MNRFVYGCYHKQSDALNGGGIMIINKGRYEADHINENFDQSISASLNLVIDYQASYFAD